MQMLLGLDLRPVLYERRIFWGFRSRWMMPLLLKTLMAPANCCSNTRIVSSLREPLAMEKELGATTDLISVYYFKKTLWIVGYYIIVYKRVSIHQKQSLAGIHLQKPKPPFSQVTSFLPLKTCLFHEVLFLAPMFFHCRTGQITDWQVDEVRLWLEFQQGILVLCLWVCSKRWAGEGKHDPWRDWHGT